MADHEEQQFQNEVKALEQWWTDSRWRYTKRSYTAEQIVNKRGTIKIDYPSNVLSKKLWKTVEQRFAVRSGNRAPSKRETDFSCRPRMPASPMAALILSWSRKWPSTSTLFMFRAGKARQPRHLPMSPAQILQTTLTQPCQTRCNIYLWHNCSTTANNAMNVLVYLPRSAPRWPTLIIFVQSSLMLTPDTVDLLLS